MFGIFTDETLWASLFCEFITTGSISLTDTGLVRLPILFFSVSFKK